jgi:putative membrane protein
MIVRPRLRLWEIFCILRLSVVPRIAPQIAVVVVCATVVTATWRRWPDAFAHFSVAPFTLLGIALSIFLGFRNNACYDRWWEARRQLGALISEVRSLARFTLATPVAASSSASRVDQQRREAVVRRIIGYVYALMSDLRGEPMPGQVARYTPGYLPASTEGKHPRSVPDALLRELAQQYGAMLAAGEFGEQIYQRLDERLSSMATIQAACERIRTTPTPFAYALLLHRTAYTFCFLLPFGLVSSMGYTTPIFSALVAYTFFGLDALGDEMEEPFGEWPNALPLTAIARTMEISLLEALGEVDVPPPLQPVESILR